MEKITKFVLKKWFFATLIAIEIGVYIAMILVRGKANTYKYNGNLIDDKFLTALAMNDYYMTIHIGLATFLIFFLAAIIFYTVGFVKFKRGTFKPKDRGAILGFILFTAVALVFTIPFIYDINARGTEKPFVMVENVVGKRTGANRAGTEYYLVLSNWNGFKVSKKRYESTQIGTTVYTVYQGKILINFLPIDKYTLDKK